MPRGKPSHLDTVTRLEVSLPESLISRVKLELFSEIEGRVPYGKLSSLIQEQLTRWLQGRGNRLESADYRIVRAKIGQKTYFVVIEARKTTAEIFIEEPDAQQYIKDILAKRGVRIGEVAGE